MEVAILSLHSLSFILAFLDGLQVEILVNPIAKVATSYLDSPNLAGIHKQ
jgi:hypothetical protein